MKYFLFIICLLPLISCQTKILNESSWELINIPAPSLENSIIENSKTQTVGIYLPPSYKANPKKFYPVVYFLQGYGNTISSNGQTCWILDSLIRQKKVPEMIFVTISGKYKFGGSFYENSPITGNWEDFVVEDVLSFIDSNYRTITKAESRAITGHSMGGYGALNLGMKHPDIFKIVYGMSPALFNNNGLKQCPMFRIDGALAPLIKLQEQLAPLTHKDAHNKFMTYKDSIKDWNIEFTLAYGICFAPNTDKAPYFKYPITIAANDTIIDQDIWNSWNNGLGNITNELIEYTKNIRQLNVLALDCGYNDNFEWITQGTQFYTHELERLHIPYIMHWHNGTHTSGFNESVHYGLFPTVATYLSFEKDEIITQNH